MCARIKVNLLAGWHYLRADPAKTLWRGCGANSSEKCWKLAGWTLLLLGWPARIFDPRLLRMHWARLWVRMSCSPAWPRRWKTDYLLSKKQVPSCSSAGSLNFQLESARVWIQKSPFFLRVYCSESRICAPHLCAHAAVVPAGYIYKRANERVSAYF